jgi:hypothetical protein
MTGMRPTDPGDLLGVYRRPGDVPDRHRLAQHAAAYEGRDVWREWAESEVLPGCGDEGARLVRRHGERWRSHMEGRRHHALARPADVHDYCAGPLAGLAGRTAAEYFRRLASFYDHLLTSTDHPHVYSPVLMAAASGGPAGGMWETAREER